MSRKKRRRVETKREGKKEEKEGWDRKRRWRVKKTRRKNREKRMRVERREEGE